MRRLILLISLLMLYLFVGAQNGLIVGATTGLNLSKFESGSSEVSATARPSVGIYIERRKSDSFSQEISGAFSMRGERIDQSKIRSEANYIDLQAKLRFHFLEVLSFAAGVAYYEGVGGRVTSQGAEEPINEFTPESRMMFPLELGLEFFNDSRIDLTYSLSSSRAFNNFAVNLQFPIWSSGRQKKARVSRRQIAHAHIAELTQVPLLVRLNSYGSSLQGDGYDSTKQKEKRSALEQNNREIQLAFKNGYDFGKVYFFESSKSKDIREGNFAVLRDFDSQPISKDKYPEKGSFYIAEFANLEPDTGKFWSNYRIVPSENGGQKMLKHYSSYDSGITYFSLMIKDSTFTRLEDPFPNHVRCLSKSLKRAPESYIFAFPLLYENAWDFNSAVDSLNEKLHRYCSKH